MDNSNIREQQITRTSVIGIVANIFLAAFKAAVWRSGEYPELSQSACHVAV